MKLNYIFSKKKRRAARAAAAEAAREAAFAAGMEAAARAAEQATEVARIEAVAPFEDWQPGQVHRPGDTAEAHMERLLARIQAEQPGTGPGVQMIRDTIAAMPDPAERDHTWHHLARLAQTYALVPDGPGSLVDVAASPIYAAPLRELKEWRINPIEILAFDYEKDPLPFEDASQEGVMLCEVMEHFVIDPLFCLNEINRILKKGGFFVVTTPNVASWFSIYQALRGMHPNRWPVYAGEGDKAPNHIHAREYLVSEIEVLLEAAGFEVETILTRDYGIAPEYQPIPGFSPEHRGETIFCRARKVSQPRKRETRPIYLEDRPFVPTPVTARQPRSGPLASLARGLRQGMARKDPSIPQAPQGEIGARLSPALLSDREKQLADALRARA